MTDEQFEFQIAQYADGTLPAADARALEARLASDAGARALLAEYRAVDAMLKREMVVPAMDYARLAQHLSDAVAAEDRAMTTIAWPLKFRGWGKAAAAAAIFFVLGSAATLILKPVSPQGNTDVVVINPMTSAATPDGAKPPAPAATAIVQVSGPQAERAAQPAVAQVAIGPSPRARQTNFGVAEQVVYRPPRVTIASGQADRQDNSRLPF